MHKFLSNYPFFILSHFSHLGPPCVWEDILHLKRMPKDADLDTVFENTEDHDIINSIAYRDTAISHGLNHYNYVTNQYVQLDEKGNIVLHGELYIKPFLHDRSLMISANYFNRETQETVEFKDVEVKMPTDWDADETYNEAKFYTSYIRYKDPVQRFIHDILYKLFTDKIESVTIISLQTDIQELVVSVEDWMRVVETESHEVCTEILNIHGCPYMTALAIMDYEAVVGRTHLPDNEFLIDKFIDDFLYTYATKKNAKGVHTQELTLGSDDEYYIEAIKLMSIMLFNTRYTDPPAEGEDVSSVSLYDRELTFGDCEKIAQLLYILAEQEDIEDDKFFALKFYDRILYGV